MEINWTVVTCLIVAFFAWSGFARGWWKESITTVLLAGLVFILQRPGWAQSLIDRINDLFRTLWDILPDPMTTFITDILATYFGITTAGGPIQLSASDSGTWIIILILVMAISTLISHFAFKNAPTFLGSLLGVVIGGLNGFLVLSLAREYLDGRALPGRTAPATEITLGGAGTFAPAAPSVSVQLTALPSITILDTVIPWILIAFGILLLISVLRTKVALETKDGGYRLNFKTVPPFYRPTPRRRKPKSVDEVIESLTAPG